MLESMKDADGAESTVDGQEKGTGDEAGGSGGESTSKSDSDKDILFQRTITFFNITDPARLFKTKIKSDE